MEWLLDNIADLAAWRVVGDDSLELELITGGGDLIPKEAEPVLILALADTTPRPQALESDLADLAEDGVWNVGREVLEQSVRVTLEGEGWSVDLTCRTLEQRRLPLQARHYESIVKQQDSALRRGSAEAIALRRRLDRVARHLDREVVRAERILKESGSASLEPRLRAEGRLRLAQEVRNVLAATDEQGSKAG